MGCHLGRGTCLNRRPPGPKGHVPRSGSNVSDVSLFHVFQGFVEFRIGAQPLHLDVDTLNERLKVQGANRMRHAMRPDEAYGMVFSLDNVIVNTRTLQHKAWQKIAQEEGLELPSMERQIYDVRPERAITEVCTATCFIQGEMLLPLSAFLCIFICIYHLMAAYKSAISCHISLPFGCVTEMVCA